MKSESAPDYLPVAGNEHVHGLEDSPPAPGGMPDLWTAVHEEAQRGLADLDADVREQVKEVQVRAGRTKGQAFLLFTYRTYSVPDCEVDPVVAGITFKAAPGGVDAEADISGEETGDVLFSVPPQSVRESRDELTAATRMLAQSLCQSGAEIATALRERTKM